jgi:hypothetical protein
MASLTQNLGTPNGSKKIHDPGKLFNPEVATLQGLGQVADMASSFVTGLQKKSAAKAATARQAQIDARAQKKFDDYNADREQAASVEESLDILASNAHFAKVEANEMSQTVQKSVKSLQNTQRLVDQGGASQAHMDTTLEQTITRLMAENPDQSREIAAYMQASGLDHYTFRDLQRQELEVASAEKTQRELSASAYKLGTEAGLRGSFSDVAEYGFQLQALEYETSVLKAQSEALLAEFNFTEKQTKAASDKLQVKRNVNALRGTRVIGGIYMKTIIDTAGMIETEEDWKKFQEGQGSYYAEMEDIRMKLHEMSGDDEKAVALIDPQIDKMKATLKEFMVGDFSFGKQQAARWKTFSDTAKIEYAAIFPMMSKMSEGAPPALVKSMFEDGSFYRSLPQSFRDGFTDEANGIPTPAAIGFRENIDRLRRTYAGQEKIPDMSVGDARTTLRFVDLTKQATEDNFLSGKDPSPANLNSWAESHQLAIGATKRIANNANLPKAWREASQAVFHEGTIPMLEGLLANPATKDKGTVAMHATRKAAEQVLSSVTAAGKRSDADTSVPFNPRQTWAIEFNQITGEFEAVFDLDEQNRRRTKHKEGIHSRFQGGALDFDKLPPSTAPGKEIQGNVNVANQMLSFLEQTREHDSVIPKNATPLSMRKAYALGDYSGLVSTTGSELKADVSKVDSRTSAQIFDDQLGALNQYVGGAQNLAPTATATSSSLIPEKVDVSQVNSQVVERASKDPSGMETIVLTSPYRLKASETTVGHLDNYAQKFGVPLSLIHAMASQESGGDQSAVSPKDARGVMQLMEGTAKDLGVDRSILEENILGGAKYMGQQLRTFNGNIPDALMAYNAGPTRVMNWIDAGRPLEWKFLKESGPYVEKILQRIENSHKIEEEEKETK